MSWPGTGDGRFICPGVKENFGTMPISFTLAFAEAGLDWQDYVVVDKQLCRPADVASLCGDASKARKILGWEPEVSFKGLVSMMVKKDLELVKNTIARDKAI